MLTRLAFASCVGRAMRRHDAVPAAFVPYSSWPVRAAAATSHSQAQTCMASPNHLTKRRCRTPQGPSV